MIRRLAVALCVLALAVPVSAQTTTTRTDRLIASTSVTIGGTAFGTSTATVATPISLNGNVTLGDASGDTINFGGRVNTTILWTTDALVDLGASGANRPRDLWLGRNAAIGGTLGVTGLTTTATQKVSGTTGLPAAGGTDFYLTGGSGAVIARAIVGDGSGWEYMFASRTGSTTTDRVGITDTAVVRPATQYSGALGQSTRKWRSLSAAELSVETLIAKDTIATIGGRILVGPTTHLTQDLPAAQGYFYVKHNNLTAGDVVYLEGGGAVEFMSVSSYYGPCSTPGNCPAGVIGHAYFVSRNADASGANDWEAGDAVFNTGATGNGFIDLYSDRGVRAGTEVGPTICGNVRLSSAYNDWEPRWCIGQLNGVYGYSASAHGVAFGDDDAENLVIDTANGIRFRNGTTVLGSWVGSTLTLGQPLTVNNTGQIYIDSDEISVNWRNNAGTTVQPFIVKSDASSSYVIVENWEFRGNTLKSYADASMTVSSGGTFTTLTLRGGSGGAGDVILYGPQVKPNANNTQTLGTSSLGWSEIYVVPTTTTTDYNPLVLGASGQVLEKTDGVSATFNPTTCTSVTYHSGLLVAKSGC